MGQIKYKVYLILAFASIAFSHCSDDVYDDSVRYKLKYFNNKYGSCDSLSADCVKISASFPEFTMAENQNLLDSLKAITKALLLQPVFGKNLGTLEELSEYLINDYKNLKKDFPGSPIRYELDRNLIVVFNQDGILSLEYLENSFLGGAHPNSVRKFVNLFSRSGKKILPGDLFIDGFERKLNALGEKKFREVRDLNPGDDLEKSGFWFPENRFRLNNNFLITGSGLTFYFNDYEIAPHSMAPTEISFKYDELRDLIDPEGILAGVAEK